MQLEALLTRQSLLRFAGARSFEQGASYATSGRVTALVKHEERVEAKVPGEQGYEVRLWANGSSLGHSCTCPVGASSTFCKHAVAVGLAYLEASSAQHVKPAEPLVTADDVRTYLLQLDPEELVAMVLEQARQDEALGRRLLARAARSSAKGIDLGPYYRAIDIAVWSDGFVDYRAMYDYCKGIRSIVGSLHELLGQGYASEVLALTEHFIAAVEAQLGHVDDSSGNLGGILYDLQNLHHAACQQSRPDPEELAGRLFAWEVGSSDEVFHGAMRRYADVLGEKGLARYCQLLEEEWEQIPALGPRDKDTDNSGRRYRITQLMLTMAREKDDVDAVAAVLSRDMSHAYDYLKIAQAYQDAGQADQSLAWAEEGLKAFSEKPDARLCEFVAQEYQRRERHDEAMALIWSAFVEYPSLNAYQNLKKHAVLADNWPHWRERGIRHLHDDLARRQNRSRGWGWQSNDGSLLVQIFLWEGEVERAWSEAKQNDCTSTLWLELAQRREVDHPADAVPIYQTQVEGLVARKNNDAYAEAAALVRRVRSALRCLGQASDFTTYLEDLKARHRRLRNFSALLRDVESEAP